MGRKCFICGLKIERMVLNPEGVVGLWVYHKNGSRMCRIDGPLEGEK